MRQTQSFSWSLKLPSKGLSRWVIPVQRPGEMYCFMQRKRRLTTSYDAKATFSSANTSLIRPVLTFIEINWLQMAGWRQKLTCRIACIKPSSNAITKMPISRDLTLEKRTSRSSKQPSKKCLMNQSVTMMKKKIIMKTINKRQYCSMIMIINLLWNKLNQTIRTCWNSQCHLNKIMKEISNAQDLRQAFKQSFR